MQFTYSQLLLLAALIGSGHSAPCDPKYCSRKMISTRSPMTIPKAGTTQSGSIANPGSRTPLPEMTPTQPRDYHAELAELYAGLPRKIKQGDKRVYTAEGKERMAFESRLNYYKDDDLEKHFIINDAWNARQNAES